MVQGVAVLQGRKTLTEKQLDAVLDLVHMMSLIIIILGNFAV